MTGRPLPPPDQQQRFQLPSHQIMSSTNMPLAFQHVSAPHFITNEQIPSMIAFHPSVGVPLSIETRMTNPTSTSTPAKLGREDLSGNAETQTQSHHPPSEQRTRGDYSNSTPSKRLRRNAQQGQGPPAHSGQNRTQQGMVIPRGIHRLAQEIYMSSSCPM